MESLQNAFDFLFLIGIITGFYAVLWALGTRDRKKILTMLHNLLDTLNGHENGNTESSQKIHKKGGDIK